MRTPAAMDGLDFANWMCAVRGSAYGCWEVSGRWASLLCPACCWSCDFGQIPAPELLPHLFCCVGQGSTRETEPAGAIYKEISYKDLVYAVVGAGWARLKSKDGLWL